MWHYYSDQHTGFCLEFDKKNDFFKNIHKVIYTENYPVIGGNDLGSDDDFVFSRKILTHKSTDWSHEKEWRVICEKSNVLYPFPPIALRSVILGKDCTLDNEQVLKEILGEQKYNHVNLFRMSLTENSYKLKPKRIANHL